MSKTFNALSIVAVSLVIVGALNWLLVGVFSFNLVTVITGNLVWLARTVYVLVGIAGIYCLIWMIMKATEHNRHE